MCACVSSLLLLLLWAHIQRSKYCEKRLDHGYNSHSTDLGAVVSMYSPVFFATLFIGTWKSSTCKIGSPARIAYRRVCVPRICPMNRARWQYEYGALVSYRAIHILYPNSSAMFELKCRTDLWLILYGHQICLCFRFHFVSRPFSSINNTFIYIFCCYG